MMIDSRFLAAMLGAGVMSLAFAAQAQSTGDAEAEPGSRWTMTGSASLVSQYIYHGISQTQGKPAVQANFDASHASGWYAGLWGSSVSHAAYNNGAGVEVDIYGGYRHDFGGGHTVDLTLYTFWFPGASYPADSQRIKYDTQQIKLGYIKGSLNAAAWYTVSKRLVGLAFNPFTGDEVSTRGSTYLEVNWNPEVAPGWTLNFHAGRQIVRNLGAYNFTDMSAGVTRAFGTWQLSLLVSYNNGDASRNGVPVWTLFDADGRGRSAVGTQAVASVIKQF